MPAYKIHSYAAVALWGKQLGSNHGYVVMEQEKAARMSAPADALYERDGKWTCVSDLSCSHPFHAAYAKVDPANAAIALEKAKARSIEYSVSLAHGVITTYKADDLASAIAYMTALAKDGKHFSFYTNV